MELEQFPYVSVVLNFVRSEECFGFIVMREICIILDSKFGENYVGYTRKLLYFFCLQTILLLEIFLYHVLNLFLKYSSVSILELSYFDFPMGVQIIGKNMQERKL